jgi:NADH dehydrogenase [ubiquinone] 1 alpha subcomplex assembly factor 1
VETDIHQHRLYSGHHRTLHPPPEAYISPLATASQASEIRDSMYPGDTPPALSDVPPTATIISSASTTTSGSTGWETVMLPFNSFVRTNHGFVVEPQTSLLRQRVKSVGIGLTDRVEGPYDLRIHRIWATNGMSEEEIREERRICGTSALPIDEGVRTGWGSNMSPAELHGQEISQLARKQTEDGYPRVKGLKGLKHQWDK